jgi:hypothetical protein
MSQKSSDFIVKLLYHHLLLPRSLRVSKCMLVGYIVLLWVLQSLQIYFPPLPWFISGVQSWSWHPPLSCGSAMLTCLQSVQLLLWKASSLSNGLQVTDQVWQVIL